MSATTPKSAGEGVPPPPVFSYAQAAKGRTTATTASAIQSNQTTTSGFSTPAKDVSSIVNTPSGGSERGDRSVNGSYEAPSKTEPAGDSSHSDVKASSTKPSSSTGSPSYGSTSTSTLPKVDKDDKDDDFVLVGAPSSESIKDRSSQGGSTATEKPVDTTEGRKGKKGKKQSKNSEKEAEKEKEEEKKEILIPAPLPTVNFWQRRKEDLAKTKPAPVVVHNTQPLSETSAPNDSVSQTVKPIDAKKRGKTSGTEDGEKPSSTAQNGTAKETSNSIKSQKKGSESAGKSKDEQANKRAGPRGSRMADKDDKAVTSQLPPPVEDAMSWPTPETALGEEKRKAQEKMEKEEKDENVSNKPRAKEKWVPVPYIPSVTFSTPIPTRGGRGRGGARSGRTEGGGRLSHSGSSGAAGDKAQHSSTNSNSVSTESERRQSRNGPRAASLPPISGKQNDNRDQRKGSTAQAGEKLRTGSSKIESNTLPEERDSSNIDQKDQNESIQDQNRESNIGASKSDQIQGSPNDSHPRFTTDRQSDSASRTSDSKDGANFNKDGSGQSRERNDARSDRGRGGFRGRGGHGNFSNGQAHPQHIFTNGHGSQQPNGYPIRQGSGPYSPPLQPPLFNNQYTTTTSRGGRGGSRSQSIPNSNMYGRFPNNGPVPQHIGALQTSQPMFDYSHLQSMSAIPYGPFVDSNSVLGMVTMQLEYYFSIDNLCKDVFLRKHMDSQGFVFLSFIAGFKRIQALTQEFELLRYACQESEVIDFVRGDDNVDRLRRKEGWEKWVLAMEDRDESVRNAGPANVHRSYPAQRHQSMGAMILPSHHSLSPPAFSPNSTESSFRAFSNGAPIALPLNGNGIGYHPETPLSAAVPDFAPGLLPLTITADPLEAEVTFPDDEVAHLTLVFARPKNNDESKPKSSFHHASSRTFSNGSIDNRSIAEELHDNPRQGRPLTNGSRTSETSPDNLRRSRSPFGPLSPTSTTFNNSPPVMWVKGQRHPALVSEQNSEELYTSFRARALRHRETSTQGETHADMKLLYEFWSHFLCRNFNLTMYTEFRKYAFEDAGESSVFGMKNLISYYDEILNSKKKVIPETLARHYVELVKGEQSNGRPAFEKLRASWRNGALDMKSRKKIDNLVDPKLREELERPPHQKSDSS